MVVGLFIFALVVSKLAGFALENLWIVEFVGHRFETFLREFVD